MDERGYWTRVGCLTMVGLRGVCWVRVGGDYYRVLNSGVSRFEMLL
jgi:hypothetical protein